MGGAPLHILLCPFDGGRAHPGTTRYDAGTVETQGWPQDTFHHVNCMTCGSSNLGLRGFDTPETAIGHWNRRHDHLAVELEFNSPFLIAVPDHPARAVQLTFKVPALWRLYGDHFAAGEVECEIEHRAEGGEWSKPVRVEIHGKTETGYVRALDLPLAGQGPWLLRLIRLTPHNGNVANDLLLAGIREHDHG
jgi:hypothetical protein